MVVDDRAAPVTAMVVKAPGYYLPLADILKQLGVLVALQPAACVIYIIHGKQY